MNMQGQRKRLAGNRLSLYYISIKWRVCRSFILLADGRTDGRTDGSPISRFWTAPPPPMALRLLLALSLAAAAATATTTSATTSNKLLFPAFFVFGDSLVDVGNNNYIATAARANVRPFGIDYPSGPSGRFSNGKVVVDFMADKFGLPYPVPYLAPPTHGKVLLSGVNYASAAGGILRNSGINFIGRVDMDTQLTWFENNIAEMKKMMGDGWTQNFINKSIFMVTLASNDYINNFLLNILPTRLMYTADQFQKLVLDKFASQLTKMYELGVRNVIVSSLGPIGCVPSQLAKGSQNGECLEDENALARGYNEGLQQMLLNVTQQNPGSKFLYADVYNPILDYRNHPEQYGFKYASLACCGAGRYKGQLLCVPILTPCPDRGDYVFWDAYHPTEKTNRLVSNYLYEQLIDQLVDSSN